MPQMSEFCYSSKLAKLGRLNKKLANSNTSWSKAESVIKYYDETKKFHKKVFSKRVSLLPQHLRLSRMNICRKLFQSVLGDVLNL